MANRDQNTTPLAIALKYDGDANSAPRIAATGRGLIAEQIIALAKEHGIDVHEDADLAEMLSVLDVDAFIPVEAFAAVAEILSYVYRKSGKFAERGTH